MKKKLSVVEWAVRNHGVVILITCCLIAFGIFGLAKMNKNEFPDFTIRQAIVVAACPGVNVSDVEEQVTKPLEDFIFSYKEVRKDKTKSFSRHGLSIIQVELNADYSDNDVFWSKFRHGLSTFKAQLPQNVLALQVNDDYAETSSMLLTIESNDKTYRELKKYADNLQESLRQVEQVGRMKLLGMQKEQISVYIDNARLSQYGISEESLAVSLFAKGFVTTAGTLHGAAYNSPVYVSRSINIENDVENTIVYSSPSGVNVRLRDIAAVKREYAEPSSEIENNGVKCLLLSIEMKKGRNITDMGGGINKVLDKFSRDLPRDVSLFKITDQTKVVSDSVTNFLKELVIAIVAVMIVVLLLLPLRVALVASSTIPITIFISLGLFYAFKIELNTVTLAALIVTLGMIVDNAIVIIDSYVETLREGRPRVEAAVGSARHFFKSILVATLAISITFFPFLLTLEGTFRDFITAFPWAITIVLAVSLLVAELVVPFLLCFFIRKPAGNSAGNGNGGRKFVFEDWLQEKYNRLITLCFAHPQRTIAAGAASIIIAALLIPFLPLRLMPVAERNQFAVELYLPTGTALKKTSAVADSLESILKKDPRVVSIASFKGMASPRFQTGYAPQFADENYAQFIVNTKSNKATVGMLDDYAAKCQDAFPDAYVRFKQLAYGTEDNPVEVRIQGSDWNEMKKAADEVITAMRNMKPLWIVRSDVNEPLMTTVITLDEDKASRLGVSNTGLELAMAGRYNNSGIVVGTLWDGDYDVNVCLKGTNADSATVASLGEEQIAVAGGLRSVPLSSIASIAQNREDGQIVHRNGIRTITVKCDVERGKNVTAVSEKVKKEISKLSLPDGITISYGGELENNGENLPKIFTALMVSVFIIFFLLLAHYKKIGTSLLLLVSLLLTLFGMVASVLIQGVDFGVTSFLGVVSLMGILVRNAIIMFDYAEELREKDKLSVRDAIYMSAKRRMHPIFLTSMAASMGVIPMILGGSGLWMPMGAIICYGTLITMCFILTVLPAAYWMLHGNTGEKQPEAIPTE